MYLYIPFEIVQILLYLKESFPCVTTYNYFIGYVWCLLTVQGRKTSRNIYKQCFFFRKNVSSWCRFLGEYKWDYIKVAEKMFNIIIEHFQQDIMIHGAVLGCYDTSLIAKSSKKILGIQKWNNHSGNPDAGDYLTGHHWGILGMIAKINMRYITFLISFRLVTGKLSNCQWKCTPDGQLTPMKIWDVSHAQLFQLNQWTKQKKLKLRVVEDAYFSNKPNIQPLIDEGIDVITRLRSNGVGEFDPDPKDQKVRGRKLKHGKEVKVTSLWKTHEHQTVKVTLYGKEETFEVVVEDLWMLELSKKVRTVVFKGKGGKLISLISTDLSLTATQIIEIYGSRFSVEIAIRDIKQHLGFEEYQHHSLFPALRFLHVMGIAYNIGKIAMIKFTKCKWLNITSDEGDPSWTSDLSFSRLRYCLRRFALEKLVFGESAKHAEQGKFDLDKQSIIRIAC
jgi:hypothetical protein